jgi:hypothetical protein
MSNVYETSICEGVIDGFGLGVGVVGGGEMHLPPSSTIPI